MASKGAIAGIAAIIITVTAIAAVVAIFSAPQLQTQVQREPILCKGTAECITANVGRIVDGDTLSVGGRMVRLSLVNTPEVGEPGYDNATSFTLKTCPIGSEATVDVDDGQPTDRFGRTVAKVWCGDTVLNAELINSKMATILSEFCDTSEFREEVWAKDNGCNSAL